jgi:Flp pilus assembly protein TadG
MMRRHNKLDRRRGTVLIEAALVFPILILLTFGLIEYGWLFLRMESITNAARRGVRVAVTPDATNSDVSSAITVMMTDAGLEDSGYTVTMSSLDVDPGETVTVHIVVPNYENISLTGAPLIPIPGQIERRVAMAKEGP